MRLAMAASVAERGATLRVRRKSVNLDSQNQYSINIGENFLPELPPLSSRDAADRLGVKVDTLYAYVSRGLLRSMEVAGSRERHYDADEVERFRTVRGGVRGVRPPPAMLMPEIDSAICLIENHRVFY